MSLITAAPPHRTRTDRRPPASRVAPRIRSRRPAWLGLGLIGAGVALLPWLFVLATSLPATTTAAHWRVAWVGLDTLEALSFVATGALLIRRDPRACLTAMVTATLLLADAWFDVSTAAPGADQVTAVAMAVVLEVPLAVFSAVLAYRTLPRAR